MLVYGEAPQSDMDWGAAQGRRLLEGRQGFRNMAGGGVVGRGGPPLPPWIHHRSENNYEAEFIVHLTW